jgi:hypothetical protein
MAAVKCIFVLTNNELVTVSGADAGTYPIHDNKCNILISATEYQIYPLNGAYCSIDTLGQVRTTVNT